MEKNALRKQTIRRNGKWAKLDRLGNGGWYAALGWEGQFKADRVMEWPKKFRYGAMVSALAWLDNDQ